MFETVCKRKIKHDKGIFNLWKIIKSCVLGIRGHVMRIFRDV